MMMKTLKQWVGGVALALSASLAHAIPSTTFDFVCTNPSNCDLDNSLSFSVTIANVKIQAGGSYDTNSDGGAGFLGWAASSDIWGGTLISGGLAQVTDASGVTFTFDSFGILDGILDSGIGPIITFTEDPSYPTGTKFLSWRQPNIIDSRLALGVSGDGTDITGTFEKRVPEPATLALMGLGLAGIGFARKKKQN